MQPDKHTSLIKVEATRLGFEACGIAIAKPLDEDAKRLENWLNKGYQGKMQYMENHFDLRIDPTKLVPGAKSVITLMLNYFPEEEQKTYTPNIAKYAYGQDYHYVIKDKLHQLLAFIKENIGDVAGRGFVDSAPVLERSWAVNSGLGWIGKNGNLLTRNSGSYLFIATLITDLPLISDAPFTTDHCGSCTRCIDACPTGAIVDAAIVDASRCISYLTIELKDALIPSGFNDKMENWMFGCDICQDVCPWNRFAKPTTEPAFTPINEVLNLSLDEWEAMTEETFKKIFKTSAISRPKFKGIKRNIQSIQQ